MFPKINTVIPTKIRHVTKTTPEKNKLNLFASDFPLFNNFFNKPYSISISRYNIKIHKNVAFSPISFPFSHFNVPY